MSIRTREIQYRMKRHVLQSVLALMGTSIVFTGCRVTQNFFTVVEIPTAPAQVAEYNPNSPGGNSATSITLRTIRPVLAVRGMGCLMCHASVKANIITDFGYENPAITRFGNSLDNPNVFLGGDDSRFVHAGSWSSWYSNRNSVWQTAKIEGTVFVPKATVPESNLAKLVPVEKGTSSRITTPSTLSLKELLELPLNYSDGTQWTAASKFTELKSEGETSFNEAITWGIRPTNSNQAKVTELNQVIIRAPTEDQIAAIAPETLRLPDVQTKTLDPSRPSQISGLVERSETSEPFLTNIQSNGSRTITCKGDVVINGVLLLKDLIVDTDSEGCRLYAKRTVLIYGDIKLRSASGTPNLQITSSRAILIGFRKDVIQDRFVGRPHNMRTRGEDHELERIANIVSDSNIPSNIDNYHEGGNPTYNYEHILLNAPVVHNRYFGNFQGVLIAEIALFRLGKFHFQFDPAFENAPVLPALENDVLVAN